MSTARPRSAPAACGWHGARLRPVVSRILRAGWPGAQLRRVLDFGEPWGDTAAARLASLRAGFSTRLGAVLRHATRTLLAQTADVRWTWVIGDGEPHDIDVPDPRLLVTDARVAVAQARRARISVMCLHPGPKPVGRAAVEVFTSAGIIAVDDCLGARS